MARAARLRKELERLAAEPPEGARAHTHCDVDCMANCHKEGVALREVVGPLIFRRGSLSVRPHAARVRSRFAG